jgi:hypothetical protein
MDADLIARLAKAWYGRALAPDDAAGLAAALAPVEAAMRDAERRLSFADMTPHFMHSLERHARD